MSTRPLTIVGLGDSTTAGTPYFLSPLEAPPDGRGNPEGQYTHWMRQLHPEWLTLNRGINGERSDEILRRVGRDALAPAPDYVIVLAGVNDVYQGRGIDSIKRDLRAIYRQTARAGIDVVGATILPFNSMTRNQTDAIKELNRWVAEETRGSGWLCCDTSSIVSAPGRPDRLAGTPDGLHPDIPGYRKIGEGLARLIEIAESGAVAR